MVLSSFYLDKCILSQIDSVSKLLTNQSMSVFIAAVATTNIAAATTTPALKTLAAAAATNAATTTTPALKTLAAAAATPAAATKNVVAAAATITVATITFLHDNETNIRIL